MVREGWRRIPAYEPPKIYGGSSAFAVPSTLTRLPFPSACLAALGLLGVRQALHAASRGACEVSRPRSKLDRLSCTANPCPAVPRPEGTVFRVGGGGSSVRNTPHGSGTEFPCRVGMQSLPERLCSGTRPSRAGFHGLWRWTPKVSRWRGSSVATARNAATRIIELNHHIDAYRNGRAFK